MQIRIHLRSPLQTLLITFTALGMAALAGCGGDGVTTSTGGSLGAPTPGPITLQSIEKCVTNSKNDVIVGSQADGAKPGCSTVNASPGGGTAKFGEIIVKSGGLLTVPASATKLNPLTVADICLESGAQFIAGSPDQPIATKFKITFTGNASDAGSSDSHCLGFKKGIDVASGAMLELYGAEGIPGNGGVSWTTLAAPAGSNVPGAKVPSTGLKTLDLTADVTQGAGGWKKGDWIVVATSSFNPEETEFVQIDTVSSAGANGAGSTITLKQPLQYYHFGSPAPSTGTSANCLDRLNKPGLASYCDGASKNYGVDERAEVGLISRDIEMTANTATITTPVNITAGTPATADSATTLDEHWGGEIMIHAGFAKVAIQGVRLSKFGKDRLGSYPIHFHRVGDIAQAPNPGTANVLINADSVDHSYNKCVTIHDTSNLTVSNLVCARIVGHIFYEELNSATDNNVADDSGITFKNDLGLGAMSNSFDINGPITISSAGTSANGFPLHDETLDRQQLIDRYWWTGDYMTNAECAADGTCISYDGFNITDTDNQGQATHGACFTFGSGVLQLAATATPCGTGQIYAEPATGFWIQNPGTNLIGNAIGGCQGVGNGFWWVPPQNPITVNGNSVSLLYQPMGTVKNDRAHACYNGFFGDNSIGFVTSSPLFPHAGGVAGAASIIGRLDGVTATRNRFRGLWMRPTWFVVDNGRFATNRDNVTLLTSGGIDGNAPGVWELLENSVVVGLSRNNVERWGPCPVQSDKDATVGGTYGCIDYTPADTSNSQVPHSGDIYDQGYQPPSWNSAGYMLYDGPVRVFHDRFVNFNYNQGWTASMPCSGPGAGAFYLELDTADCQFLQKMYELKPGQKNASNLGGPPVPYEGDAALGWFQSNANSYPTGTASRQLSFVNTNLRHQVYTEQVSLNTDFNDGDKNTAILDEDSTLSGLGVELAPNSGTIPVYPISLNNLPFNSTSNSVDECISRGAQNNLYEGRTSALMSPASVGTLQFSSLYPYSGSSFPGTDPNGHWQQVSFTRDDLALAQYPTSSSTYTGPFPATSMYPMIMRTGRQGLGSYEPKVSNRYGYTVAVAPTTAVGSPMSGKAGLAHWIDITLADIVDPDISTAHPFFVRLGIDYNTKKHGPPPDASYFTIKRGYKSYVGGNVWQGDPALLKYWKALTCTNLDSQNLPNLPTADGGQGDCPGGTVTTLTAVSSISGLTNTDGTPKVDAYYYDKGTGYLYLNIVQDVPNPVAPSPTGSCANGNSDPACPDTARYETYYACPKDGCMDYTIAVKSDSTYTYTPGASSTGAPSKTDLKPAPTSENQLVLHGTTTVIKQQASTDKQGIPFNTATTAPVCATTQPPQP